MKKRPHYYQTEKERKAWKRDATEVKPMSQVLPEVNKALGLDKMMARIAVMRLWSQVVDPPWTTASEAVLMKPAPKGAGEILLVKVGHAAAATDLRFAVEAYRERLNAYHQQTGLQVNAIEVRVG